RMLPRVAEAVALVSMPHEVQPIVGLRVADHCRPVAALASPALQPPSAETTGAAVAPPAGAAGAGPRRPGHPPRRAPADSLAIVGLPRNRLVELDKRFAQSGDVEILRACHALLPTA